MSTRKTGNQIGFISFLQFAGVLSVIFIHSMNGMGAPSILRSMEIWIKTYVIPLFFFVSAFLFSYKGGYEKGVRDVLSKRFQRLIVPYILWNAAFLIPKYILFPMIKNVTKDTGVELSLRYFVYILLRPRDIILGHTWFLFALFEMFLIAILLDKARTKKGLWIQIALALAVINCFGIKNRWFAVGDLMKNGVFFWCGMLLGNYTPAEIESFLKEKCVAISVIILAVGTTVLWAFLPDMYFNTLVLGFSVIFLLMIIQVHSGTGGGLIQYVSDNSFPIYIMHWPVIMVLRLVFYQKMGLGFLPSMMINLVLCLAIPCGIACLLRRIKAPWIQRVRKYVFGM